MNFAMIFCFCSAFLPKNGEKTCIWVNQISVYVLLCICSFAALKEIKFSFSLFVSL